MNNNIKYLITLAGPTAVGKTMLSINLAQHFNTVIVNADSRQVYREMKIGTARPDDKEITMAPHYFFGTHSIEDYLSAGIFSEQVNKLFEDLFRTYDLIIFTGGSGLYIKGAIEGFDEIPEVESTIRERLNSRYAEEGLERLVQELKVLDPEYYAQVDKNNPQRVIRALEVCLGTGKKYSGYRKSVKREKPYTNIKIALERDRTELFDRINRRVDEMMSSGLLEEVKTIFNLRHLPALQTVGYQELFDFLEGNCSLENAVEMIKQNTRKFAKRQMTWFKKDKEFTWFHPNQTNEIIEFIETETRKTT
ncbi:MAG: tRNA (adenosine(37)-N6)-dimethylallyltransferase MiaA [Cytophagaceae bacterium]